MSFLEPEERILATKIKKIAFVLGATASGKTDYANWLRERYKVSLINGDVAQMYQGVEVGTARPSDEENPGELFGVLKDPVNYNIAKYRQEVSMLAHEVELRGEVPVIVGGCFFYAKSLLFNRVMQVDELPLLKKEEIHKITEALNNSDCGSDELYKMLEQVDPKRAQEIHPNDRYRTEVALRLFLKTGHRASDWLEKFDAIAEQVVIIMIDLPTNVLQDRIRLRLEKMLPEWINEVDKIKKSSWCDFVEKKGFIGYKELLEWILSGKDGSKLEFVKEKIYKKTWNYSKKQNCFWRSLRKMLTLVKDEESEKEIKIVEIKDIESFFSINFEKMGFEKRVIL